MSTARSARRPPGRGDVDRPRPKPIAAHTDEELDHAIQHSISHLAQRGIDFYRVLHGIDAYMERRERRAERQKSAVRARLSALAEAENFDDNSWGDS